jgi:hypothetical protein
MTIDSSTLKQILHRVHVLQHYIINQWFSNRGRHHLPTRIEVTQKPAMCQIIDHGQQYQYGYPNDQRQRQDKTQRELERSNWH